MSEQKSCAEKLREVAEWVDRHDRAFLDRFSLTDLIALWEYKQAHLAEVHKFADKWTEEQIAQALGHCGANEDRSGVHLICMLRVGHLGSHNTAPDDTGDSFGWAAGSLYLDGFPEPERDSAVVNFVAAVSFLASEFQAWRREQKTGGSGFFPFDARHKIAIDVLLAAFGDRARALDKQQTSGLWVMCWKLADGAVRRSKAFDYATVFRLVQENNGKYSDLHHWMERVSDSKADEKRKD